MSVTKQDLEGIHDHLIVYCPMCLCDKRKPLVPMNWRYRGSGTFEFLCRHTKCNCSFIEDLNPNHPRYGGK